MKTYLMILVSLGFLSLITIARAERVGGYYRSNGTYVQSYERSDRNNTRSDNYGYGSGSYRTRDSDNDGIANYRDNDDDNDGISDDNERRSGGFKRYR